jgi:hypothetical protein
MGVIYEVSYWDGLKWHDIHTKFHKDWFKHSSNIKVIISTISEASMLVLLMGGIYDAHPWNGLRWLDIHTSFHDYEFITGSSNIKVITYIIWKAAMLALLRGGI